MLDDNALTAADPTAWPVAPDWQPQVDVFWRSAAGARVQAHLQQRLGEGAVIYPRQPLRALALTPLADVRVVILGQDPYHGPGQAEGLSFSVAPGVKVPPSLRNMFKELQRDLGVAPPANGSLVRWAEQGVLLLNSSLTVESGAAASHAKIGWQALTSSIVQAVAEQSRPVVFLLWGGHAQQHAAAIAQAGAGRHLVLQANHPSPLSALRPPVPFIGCGHFGEANRFLQAQGQRAIDW